MSAASRASALTPPTLNDGKWVIETQGLAIGYDGRLVLEQIDLRIPAGALTCIIGGSGCGKSTLLKACVGLVKPVRGSMTLLGVRIDQAMAEEARATLLARRHRRRSNDRRRAGARPGPEASRRRRAPARPRARTWEAYERDPRARRRVALVA